MKLLTFTVAFALAVCSTLVSGRAIYSRSLPASCPEGGKVLEQSTVKHLGTTLSYVSGTCGAGYNAVNATKRADIEKRQTICANGECSPACENLSNYDILVSDCAYIISYLDSYGLSFELTVLPQPPISFGRPAESFILSAQGYAYWSYNTCQITIVNADYVDYTVCYAVVGYESAVAIEYCVGVTAGAVCVGQTFAIG
ncbi:hypothetical protein F5148DRAFT_1146394 [Russula earlei]|uniref:Uncharacterized protein n=1 Tax=Russula earlei TaxID=71964 RepID=A0ACC0ULI6_9AGAM|nr:hypothetical protein F5148DRAFT_1146394 [Russula earlei]